MIGWPLSTKRDHVRLIHCTSHNIAGICFKFTNWIKKNTYISTHLHRQMKNKSTQAQRQKLENTAPFPS